MKIAKDEIVSVFDLNDYIDKHGRDEKIIKAEQYVIDNGYKKDILDFAHHIKYADINKLQDAIIKCGDSAFWCYFARDVKGADVKLLQQLVIDSKYALEIYLFAMVEGADVEKLEDAVIDCGDAQIIELFAKNVEGANIKKLQDAILKTNSRKYINKFAKEVKGADKSIYVDNRENEAKLLKQFWEFADSVSKTAFKLSKNSEKCFSKIGGYPLVDENFVWPTDSLNNPIPFAIQIDFEEINSNGTLKDFPKTGLLYIFLDDDKINSKETPVCGEDFQIIYTKKNCKNLLPLKLKTKKFAEKRVKTVPIKTYPDIEIFDEMNQMLDELPDKERKNYFNKCSVYVGMGMIGGWPQNFQSNYIDKNEIQLLQLGSYAGGFMFGDYGNLEFYISNKDLKNLDFSKVKVNLETT